MTRAEIVAVMRAVEALAAKLDRMIARLPCTTDNEGNHQ